MYKIKLKNVTHPTISLPIAASALLAATDQPAWFHIILWAAYLAVSAYNAYLRMSKQTKSVDLDELLRPLWENQQLDVLDLQMEQYQNMTKAHRETKKGQTLKASMQLTIKALGIKDGDLKDLQNKIEGLTPFPEKESQNSPV